MSAVLATEREFGELSERVLNLGKRVEEVREEVKGIDAKVDIIGTRIDTTFARLDGGWKVLVFMAGVAGSIGAFLAFIAMKMWPFLLGTLPRI